MASVKIKLFVGLDYKNISCSTSENILTFNVLYFSVNPSHAAYSKICFRIIRAKIFFHNSSRT